MIRILLIDDHQVVRTGLRLLIETEADYEVIGEAGGRAEALEAIKREPPDIILLDIDLNEENGLDFLPQLLERSSQSRIILLTGIRDVLMHQEAIRLGAMGIVMKEKAAGALLQAIRKVYEGEVWLQGSLLSRIIQSAERRSTEKMEPEEETAARILSLTDREKKVIALLCEGLKSHQIADRMFVTEGTIRNYLTSIFHKLQISDRTELAIFAYKNDLYKSAH